MQHDGILVLEDGRAFQGRRFGARIEAGGEVVFNTAMTGYQEVLTDPSYTGQLVLMTAPMIGNVGLAPEDDEAPKPGLKALLVKEASRLASSWRKERDLDAYLREHGVCGLEDFDTRALTLHLRRNGALRGIVAERGSSGASIAALVAKARALTPMAGRDLATGVSISERYGWSRPSTFAPELGHNRALRRDYHVVAYDFGVKRNILRRLVDEGCAVTVVPAHTSAQDVLALRPDGVLLSNGPGDPEPVGYAIEATKRLLGEVPIFGICLGHQLLGLALGGRTYKLKFGHHGLNHPVLDHTSGKVEVTSHNHGFAVDPDSLDPGRVALTHVDLNDQTLEGMSAKDAYAMSVQFHPEAAAGPHDSAHLFRRFTDLMASFRREQR